MTHALDLVSWSGANLSMEEFVNSVRFSLPVLAVTTSGYAGCDEYIHEVSTNEICWVYDIQRQSRIVAKSDRKEYLSIPTDYDTKFEVVGQKNKGSVTAEQLLDILKATGETFKARFVGDQKVRYQVGAASESVAKFGEFEIIDSYEEKFVLTYTLSGGGIFPNTVPVPVYIPITMDVAAGFTYGTERQFQTWCNEVKNITTQLISTPAKSRELIIFTEKPSSGVYEYLIPSLFVPKHVDSREKYEPLVKIVNNEYIVHQKNDTSKSFVKPQPPIPARPSFRETIERRVSSQHPQKVYPLPPMPRRAVPPIPTEDILEFSCQSSSNQSERPSIPPPNAPVRTHQKFPNSTDFESSVGPRTVYNQSDVRVNCSLSCYTDISDIPVNIDIKLLTKNDVSHILHLMKLDHYRVQFEDNDVDGLLLATLSEAEMISELGIDKIPARRLSMFVHEGWRPK